MKHLFSLVTTGRNLCSDLEKKIQERREAIESGCVVLSSADLPTEEQLETTHSKPIVFYSEGLH